MAANQTSDEDKTIATFKALDEEDFINRTNNWKKFVGSHAELPGDKRVSPRTFELIFDDHFYPAYEILRYLHTELRNFSDAYHALGSETGDDAKKAKLTEAAELAVSAGIKHEGLLTDIARTVKGCVARVRWKKHGSSVKIERLGNWLTEKKMSCIVLLTQNTDGPVKTAIETVLCCMTQGTDALSTANSTMFTIPLNDGNTTITTEDPTPDSTMPDPSPLNSGLVKPTRKRDSLFSASTSSSSDEDDVDDSPSPKRQKQDVQVGQWWGPDRSKLHCTDAFFNVVRDFRSYIANPPHAAGSKQHYDEMTGFLKRALDQVSKGGSYDKLMLRSEWNFRDPGLRLVYCPAIIQVGVPESRSRLGDTYRGFRGMNDFKAMLGGGLSAYEREEEDHLPGVQGMLALTHSYGVDGRVGLRGGGLDDAGAVAVTLLKATREATKLRFRDPTTLWHQVKQDAAFPKGVFQLFVEQERPPMMDPDRVGSHAHERIVGKLPDSAEWDEVRKEIDPVEIADILESFADAIDDARAKVQQFLRRSEYIVTGQPKLNEPGGRHKPKRRYKGNVRDKDFAKPIGYAFRARMYQVFRLALVWKLYLQGKRKLAQLISEERDLLEIWDEHEEVYLEWENYRWFELSSPYEIAELENRYGSRELLRELWKNQRQAIDKVLENLAKDPEYYDGAAHRLIEAGYFAKSGGLPPTPQSKSPFSSHPGATTPKSTPASPWGASPTPKSRNKKPNNTPPNRGLDGDDDVNDTSGDGKVKSTSGGNDIQEITRKAREDANVEKAIRFLEVTVQEYKKEMYKVIEKNDRLDNTDPGNAGVIRRNNIDIMAKQQVIWSFDTEILNLKRSLDPFDKSSFGRGAKHRHEVPNAVYSGRHTTPIPEKKPLPLGVTSLGLGPMPGEHPVPDHPRVLIGCAQNFGEAAEIDEGSIEPFGSNYLDAPGSIGARVEFDPRIPKDWPGFLGLFRISWGKKEPSGTAELDWDGWIQAVSKALENSTQDLKQYFPDDSPYKLGEYFIFLHVQEAYTKRFESRNDHDDLRWRIREVTRRFLLDTFAREVNAVLTANGQAPSFEEVGVWPMAPPDPTSADASAGTQLAKLRGYVRNMNESNQRVKKITKMKQYIKVSRNLEQALEDAKKAEEEYKALYKKAKMEVDETTRVEAELMEKEEGDRHTALIKAEEEFLEQRAKRHDALLAAHDAKWAGVFNKTSDKVDDVADPVEEADTAAENDTSTTTPQPTAEVELAEELVQKAYKEFEAAELEHANSVRDEEKVADAVKATDDEYLEKVADHTRRVARQTEDEMQAASARHRFSGLARDAQRAWDDPAETAEQLQKRYEDLTQDWDKLVASYFRGKRPLTVLYQHNEWILMTTRFMHEAFKAIGFNVGPAYWTEMYDSFWDAKGDSLSKKRAIWLHALVADLNNVIAEEKGPDFKLFAETPEKPPLDWYKVTVSRRRLVDSAEDTDKAAEPETPGPVKKNTEFQDFVNAQKKWKDRMAGLKTSRIDIEELGRRASSKPPPRSGLGAQNDNSQQGKTPEPPRTGPRDAVLASTKKQQENEKAAKTAAAKRKQEEEAAATKRRREEEEEEAAAQLAATKRKQEEEAAAQLAATKRRREDEAQTKMAVTKQQREEAAKRAATKQQEKEKTARIAAVEERIRNARQNQEQPKTPRTPNPSAPVPTPTSAKRPRTGRSANGTIPSAQIPQARKLGTDGLPPVNIPDLPHNFFFPDNTPRPAKIPTGANPRKAQGLSSGIHPDADGDIQMSPPAPSKSSKSESPTAEARGPNDAWPDLRDIIQAVWNAKIAREALRQQGGDGSEAEREGWPRPTRRGDADHYSV
ncbi:hypothetical protein F5Y03DRAFT_170407 [Xylaria venustula]|nr:hypothetical protein F5Y03DRAFT_170407 [Xylaria venustula]